MCEFPGQVSEEYAAFAQKQRAWDDKDEEGRVKLWVGAIVTLLGAVAAPFPLCFVAAASEGRLCGSRDGGGLGRCRLRTRVPLVER